MCGRILREVTSPRKPIPNCTFGMPRHHSSVCIFMTTDLGLMPRRICIPGPSRVGKLKLLCASVGLTPTSTTITLSCCH